MLNTHYMRSLICLILAIAGAGAISSSAQAAGRSIDYTIDYDRFVSFSIDGKLLRLAIHDDGPEQIRVSFFGGSPVIFRKNTGFDQHDSETLIYSHGRSSLLYVNTISGTIGACIIRLRSD